MRVTTSLTCGWRGSCPGRRALVTARVMLPRVFPEGTSEGGTRLREAPGLDAALPRARHMDPKASSTRDSTQRDVWRGGATIFGKGVGPVDLTRPNMLIRVL